MRAGTVIGSWLLAVVGPAVAFAQWAEAPDLLNPNRQVITWGNRPHVVPDAIVEGDWLLTGWGPSIVDGPAAAVTQLSTGKSWTIPATSDEFLSARFCDGSVHVTRHSQDGLLEHQIRDRESGAVRHSQSIPFGPNMTYLRYLKTVFLAGDREVFDRQTGERRGQLPDAVPTNARVQELAGRLYAAAEDSPGLKPDLLEIDLETLQVTHRVPMAELSPDRELAIPVMSDGQTLVVSPSVFSQPLPAARSLTAIDLRTNQVIWQVDVAFYAPLYFVHDWDEPVEIPQNQPHRPLLVHWATGEQRIGNLPINQTDLAKWVLPGPPVLVQWRQLDDVLAMFLAQPNRTSHLMGVNSVGLPLWQRELGLLYSERQGGGSSSATVSMSDRMAAITQANQVEIVDLQTGETTHVVTPESLGLVSRTRPLERSPDIPSPSVRSSSAGPTVPSIFSENNAVLLLVVILLTSYLVVRRMTLRPEKRPPQA